MGASAAPVAVGATANAGFGLAGVESLFADADGLLGEGPMLGPGMDLELGASATPVAVGAAAATAGLGLAVAVSGSSRRVVDLLRISSVKSPT